MSDAISTNLGPTCPDCGAPLRSPRHGCRRCGFSPQAPDRARGGVLTPFGYGFCGFGVGMLLGLVLNLACELKVAGSAPLLGLLMCLACATLASQVGKRLAPELRCSYEHLLVSLVAGGLVTLVVEVVYPLPVDACAGLWLVGAVLAYGLMRRYGYRNIHSD